MNWGMNACNLLDARFRVRQLSVVHTRFYQRAARSSRRSMGPPPAAAATAGNPGPQPHIKSPINPASVTLAAGCAALLAAGVVPKHDLAFSLLWPLYIIAVNSWRFGSNAQLQGSPAAPLVAEAWVRHYAAAAGVLAILVPAVVCIIGRVWGPPDVLQLAGPHLYLVTAQVVCEFLTGGPRMAMLPRMLVPLGFNTWRMWTLWSWLAAAVAAGAPTWHVALAAANLLGWGYNLLIFLLLDMLPRYLDPAKCAV